MLPRACRRLSALGLAALGALSALFSASPAEASPEDVFGFGARSSALGATGTASAVGYEAVYGNPALLSIATKRQLTLGFMGAAFDLSAHEHISYEALHGTIIGATIPIPFGGALKDRVAIGLGFFTPLGLVVRGRILYPETPQFFVPDRTQSVAVQAGIGVHLGHGFRIGGGFAALAALSGSVLVATDASGRIGTLVEDTLVASYGPIAGLSYDIGDTYRAGIAFRGKLEGRFNVVINVRDLGQIVVPPLNISGVAQYDPWQISAEFARVKGPWRFAAGATFKRWSEYPGLVEATVRCPDFDPETGQPITEECAALVVTPPDFSDTVAAHVGVERIFEPARGVGMAARAGFVFEPTPAPEQSAASNLYDNHRAAFTLGYGLELGAPFPPIELDMFAQLHVLVPREHAKKSGADAAAAGASVVESRGIILAAGTTAGVKF